MSEQLRKAEGTVEFIWDGDDHVLLNIDPEDPSVPHTFEVGAELWAGVSPTPAEGDRIEVGFRSVSYEVVDPDSGPSDRERAEVVNLRVI